MKFIAGAHHFFFMDQMPPQLADNDAGGRANKLAALYADMRDKVMPHLT
ncbi:hypothetical protein [Maritalea mediterranea]|uniref:Uncharacterized protein n=1 Tax=Maritalea mediterranea TaxID=2909667 RepID=A0ABS9E6A8_9HYPH|nr:hypothetical protein [Maritalea mediterranea]MCF4096963.1 hypothetical protein [Maritalea mediterranea]